MTPAAEADRRLPLGFEVRLRADLVRSDRDDVLVGGSPARVVRLSERARRLLDRGRVVVDGPVAGELARRLLEGNLADPVVDGTEVSPDELTVVVPVRDRAAQLDRCLAALVPLRVLVVDDASEDPGLVARVAKRYGAGLLPLPRNLGPAGARNAGLSIVTTPLVAFVDSDVVVDSAVLLDLARHFRDPRVALVGPRVAGVVRSERPRWFERYDAVASSLDLGPVPGQVRPAAAVAYLPSACLVGRTALLGAGFDERLRLGEDVDLVWRLADAGLVVRYDPACVAHHDVRGTVRGWLGRKFAYGTSSAELARRHGDKVAPAALSLTAGVGAAGLLLRRRWSLPLAGAALVLMERSVRRTLPPAVGSSVLSWRLSALGLGWAVRQEAGLLLRHWWPLTAALVPVSRSVRRALATAVLLDLALMLRDHPGGDPAAALVARRLDDLAYGSGLWWGAVRRRSAACLAVRRPHARSRPPARP